MNTQDNKIVKEMLNKEQLEWQKRVIREEMETSKTHIYHTSDIPFRLVVKA
ncbi:hypothetical protein O0555_21760 [Brevibacillus laterosporus]|uniref:hypothetical protein n=1 Tax=Brevibacillus laterosporus TaxID=1465 RepID=UPI0018CE8884|nr:hypothetical protein [Brevibacillus laterosporus]MCR8939932.1 hypothetical protein [Brevibacillus laterosporus]MCZ0842572.1 hypothetical protein [Brevibacillus laterosporus]MCZ0847129.1 hypothetical protein [Brevibacillus laterosporus]MED1911303.1 hypothetical protein [Brevibacillus laterosporus]